MRGGKRNPSPPTFFYFFAEIMSPAATVEAPVAPDVEEKTEQATTADKRAKPLPPHAVLLHNDEVNGFDFVIGVLRKVFRYERVKAFQLTLEAHERGRSIVWSGQKEIAELKADQIRSCGADPQMKHKGALTLKVTVEPLPE
jgi:ATP-dependent Clp protease adaptor protein ClpS